MTSRGCQRLPPPLSVQFGQNARHLFIENILSVQEQVHGSAKSTKKRKSEVVSLNKMISENNVVLHKNTVGTTHTSVQNSLKIEN